MHVSPRYTKHNLGEAASPKQCLQLLRTHLFTTFSFPGSYFTYFNCYFHNDHTTLSHHNNICWGYTDYIVIYVIWTWTKHDLLKALGFQVLHFTSYLALILGSNICVTAFALLVVLISFGLCVCFHCFPPAEVLSSEALILCVRACGGDRLVAVIHHLFGRGDYTGNGAGVWRYDVQSERLV